jgi:peptide/nickel transport system substrate-binding protein
MYTNNTTSPLPIAFMIAWYAGENNVAQKSNSWNGQNYSRYQSAEYDKIFDAVRVETDLEKAAEMFIQLNDILINDIAVVPVVNRASDKYAIATTLRDENIAQSDLTVNYWNIANWNRTS